MNFENLTPSVERIIGYASIEASRDKCAVGSEHLLIGMLLEPGAGIFLKAAGFTVEALRKGEGPQEKISGI